MTPTEVQNTLNMIGYNREFTVVFTKKDGTQRKITGYMESPVGEPKQSVAVPVVTEEGWKSFRIDSVLEIFLVAPKTRKRAGQPREEKR